jgi:hypothetical protein
MASILNITLLFFAFTVTLGIHATSTSTNPVHLAKTRKTTTKTNSGKRIIRIAFNEKKNYIVNGDF